MAVQYDGGVIMGADSRTSTGTYVANRVSDKITSLHDHIYACRSGSAADTQAITDYVRYFLASHRYVGALTCPKQTSVLSQQGCRTELWPCYSKLGFTSFCVLVVGEVGVARRCGAQNRCVLLVYSIHVPHPKVCSHSDHYEFVGWEV